MSERSLNVWVDQSIVGTLKENNNIWSFQYHEPWLNEPNRFSLSPHLPLNAEPLIDGASYRPVQWYFDNLLPEEGQRTLLAADARIDVADAFGLLSCYGAESAGSLTLLPADQQPVPIQQSKQISLEALDSRIRQLPKTPLTHGAAKRMSLAGAQHKLAVLMRGDELFEPAGATASTHILKPDHPDQDYAHSVINEWFVMLLARRLGLVVPNVHRFYVPAPIYLIDRFDRITTAAGTQRLHAIDACQLLGLDRSFKYSEATVDRLRELANACRSPSVAHTRLFSWLVFNVLVGNGDAHLKNLSFLVSNEGIQIAPFYDLLSTASYETPTFDLNGWPALRQLAWPIHGVRNFLGISRELLIDAGLSLGLAKSTAQRLLDHLIDNTFKEAKGLYAEVEEQNSLLVQARPELRLTMAGESRCLRTVLHVIIKAMTQQLARKP